MCKHHVLSEEKNNNNKACKFQQNVVTLIEKIKNASTATPCLMVASLFNSKVRTNLLT
jgi:hypothetical protein